ncbi:MAG: hypothetical protein NTV04_13050, partial [Deltaproteobacteria bacterium]|nr:hypothetical protein [Deltaproteobacteria bacterium]
GNRQNLIASLGSQSLIQVHFSHSRENGNPDFSKGFQILDSRLSGNDDFLCSHIFICVHQRKSASHHFIF